MAQKHELEITIGNDGEIGIAVSGVNGPECLKITEDLEQELGIVLSREKKSEFYKEKTDTQTEINLT